MVVPSTREMVSVIRAALAEVLRKAGFSATDIEDIKLAVNEACTNILAHAYKWRQDGVLILRLSIQPERLMIRIRDFGAKAPPESFKSRDLDNLAPSGVGIFLMKELMDEVHYDHSHAVGTELILVKERPRADKLKL
jgi:anti-sigma regulatory factor (Ser/Thr protein kinase)